MEHHGLLREAKAHRSPVSETGIAYSAPTSQSGAYRVEPHRHLNISFKKNSFLNNSSKARPIANFKQDGFQSKNDSWRPDKSDPDTGCFQKINSATQHKVSFRNSVPSQTPENPATFGTTKKSKLSSAMRDLVRRHLSGSCNSEQFKAHLLNEQNLRFKNSPAQPGILGNLVPVPRQFQPAPKAYKQCQFFGILN